MLTVEWVVTRVKEGSVQPTALRREPVQERSAARVQRMLDAAADLLDSVGYEATTTSAVARKARVSVGSLYQFFPDRRAVLQALALRSFARFSEQLSQALDRTPLAGWRDAVDLVVTEYVAFTRSEPGMRVLSFGGPVDRQLLLPDEDNNAVVSARLAAVLAVAVPGLEVDEALQLALRVAVEAADGVLDLAFRRDPAGDPAVVAETTRLLQSYLAGYLDSPGD
ncbi:MAG: putative transcriptional regulator, TetR family [Frankiales bacterium]|nr:putative transcriptional regulator, TetR family [Frankiales bacterium]